MQLFRRICLGAALVALIVMLSAISLSKAPVWPPAAVVACIGLALGLAGVPSLRGYQFTAWIVAAAVAAMIYPARFLHLGPFDLRNPWIVLFIVQLVMFGMGTQMSLRDFAGIIKMPWGVLVGIFCHFTIMPLVGLALTKLFSFPNEIAAGVILIGSCSSGLASNVMVYLARGSLPLSITITAVATMLAPLMTPLWMKLLAAQLVDVDFFKMMLEIIEIVIVPIGAALLHDYLKFASPRDRGFVFAASAAALAWLICLPLGGWDWLTVDASPLNKLFLAIPGFLAGAVVAGTAYHLLATRVRSLDRYMPLASMFGIIYFTAVTTAAGRDNLLHVGGLLFLAAVIHNTLGYVFGYWLSRALGLDRAAARTVAFEVGLQNGGMATGLASAMGKLGTVGLASAIFSPWMNVSGSILANYWRIRPVKEVRSTPDAQQKGPEEISGPV
jgi:bile acid:Na+ symporter, BASS family